MAEGKPVHVDTRQGFVADTETILEEAYTVTSGDRNRYYGHPLDNHGNTAHFWTGYLRRKGLLSADAELSIRDVCLMMCLLKISRDANREHRDNLVDLAGYARNVEMADEERIRRSE